MKIDFTDDNHKQLIIENIIEYNLLPKIDRMQLMMNLRSIITIQNIINKCAEYSIVVEENPVIAKEQKIFDIRREYTNQLYTIGIEVLTGVIMKCSFDDALIVREAAQFRKDNGVIDMTLKDVNGVLHKDISVDIILSTVVPVMCQRYAFLWESKEIFIELVGLATTNQEVSDIPVVWV